MNKKILLIFLALKLFSGCAYKVATPPAKFSSTNTPAVLKKEQRKIKMDGGVYSEIFGPGLSFGSVEYSQGLGSGTELSLRPMAAMVLNEGDNRLRTSRKFILGMSADLKTNPSSYLGRHFALYGGGGYAYSYYAQILSTHGGMILGYEGRYFVPYFSTEVFFSIPTSTKPVPGEESDFMKDSQEDSESRKFKSPTITYGIKPVLGLKLNLSETLSIIYNTGLALAQSKTDGLGIMHMNLGVEWNFGN